MTGIGEELRRERQRQGLTLDAIALRTKIPVRSLEALEAEAFDRLPGIVFTRNFVRLYALDLKLDPENFLSRLPRFDIDSAPLPDPPARPGRDKWDPRLKAAVASVVWLATAGAAGAGAWYYYNHYGRSLLKTVTASPAPVFAKSPSPASIQPVPAKSEPPQPNAAQSGAPQPDASNAAFTGNRPVQVILTAKESVWVQVSADGHTTFVGTLHPNDTRTVAADDRVMILTGNAGGLDISLNGKPLDPIGPRGQTRTVSLTAEGPQFAPKNPPVSSPL